MSYHYGSVIKADRPDVVEVRYAGALSNPVIAHWTSDRPKQFVGIKTTAYFTGDLFICFQ